MILMSLFYTFFLCLSNVFMHIFKIIFIFLYFSPYFMNKIKIIMHNCIIYKNKKQRRGKRHKKSARRGFCTAAGRIKGESEK